MPKEARFYPWYVVTILLIAGITSYLDRNLMYLLVDPIRHTMDLTDVQISLLEGLAFSLFFITLGIPLGHLIDRRNRRNLIIAGVAIWSVMTLCCGLAQNYAELFAARAGVGFGEAILGPAAYSLIADYFEFKNRAKAASVYNMSNFLGMTMSSLIGGTIIHLIGATKIVSVPLMGAFVGWQVAFFVAAAMGAPIIVLMLTVREPVRKELGKRPELGLSIFRQLKAYPFAYFSVYANYILMTFVGLSNTAWGPAYLARRFGLAPAEVAFILAPIALVPLSGAFVSGWLSDRFALSDKVGGRFRTPLVGWPILFASQIGYLFAPSLWLVLVCAALAFFGGAIILVSCPPVLQDITPNNLRGRAQALFYTLSITIGLGIAPTAVALVTDYVFHDSSMLRYSLAVVQIPALVLGWVIAVKGQAAYEVARIVHRDSMAVAGEAKRTSL